MLENCAGEIDITIGLNVDGVIFVMWIIILPSQNVFELFLSKILASKSEKHNIGDVLVSVDKYQSKRHRGYRYATLASTCWHAGHLIWKSDRFPGIMGVFTSKDLLCPVHHDRHASRNFDIFRISIIWFHSSQLNRIREICTPGRALMNASACPSSSWMMMTWGSFLKINRRIGTV